jgi:hypothetical protein
VSLCTRITAIFADLIVLGVTWYKAIGTVREAYRVGIKVPISEILLRDGQFSALDSSVNLMLTICCLIGILFFL